MNTVTCQGIQEDGEGGNQGLSFTSSHLRNLTLMKNGTTKQLYIIVYHFPFQVVTSGCPVIVVDGLISIDGNEILLRVSSQLSIKVGGRYNGFLIFSKAFGSLFHNGKHFRHNLIKSFLIDIQNFLFNLVNLSKDVCTLIDRGIFNGGLEFCNTGFLLLGRVLHLLL